MWYSALTFLEFLQKMYLLLLCKMTELWRYKENTWEFIKLLNLLQLICGSF